MITKFFHTSFEFFHIFLNILMEFCAEKKTNPKKDYKMRKGKFSPKYNNSFFSTKNLNPNKIWYPLIDIGY